MIKILGVTVYREGLDILVDRHCVSSTIDASYSQVFRIGCYDPEVICLKLYDLWFMI